MKLYPLYVTVYKSLRERRAPTNNDGREQGGAPPGYYPSGDDASSILQPFSTPYNRLSSLQYHQIDPRFRGQIPSYHPTVDKFPFER